MVKGWYGNKQAHALASRGIRISDEIIKETRRCKMRPYDINCGYCETFAQDIIESFEDARIIWLDEFPELEEITHCVILYKGRYYDSENPDGVDSPFELEIVKNIGNVEYHKKMRSKGKIKNNPEDLRPSKFKYVEVETMDGRKKKMFVEIIAEKGDNVGLKEYNKYGESKDEIYIGKMPKRVKDVYWNIKYGKLVVID